jgi:hypothetical protein
MNRRKFLTALGLAPLVAKAAPLLKLLPESDVDYYRRKRAEAGPGGWVSYKFKYTVTLPPERSSRMMLSRTEEVDGHILSYRTYVRGKQALLV